MRDAFRPTGSVRLQRKGDDPLAFGEYKWNRGDGEGLQFEGSVSTAAGKDGCESILNLTIFNLPRAQRGEVPLKNALIEVRLGYEETETHAVFAGHIKTGKPSMVGATSEWSIYGIVKSKRAGLDPVEVTGALKSNQAQEVRNVGALIDELALRGGISVTVSPQMRSANIRSTTLRGAPLDLINEIKNAVVAKTGRPFVLAPVEGLLDTYTILDVGADAEGIPVLVVEPSKESVYLANFEIVQNQEAPTEQNAEQTPQQGEDPEANALAPEEDSYALFYVMDLPLRTDIKCGTYVNVRSDPQTGVEVTFLVTSVVHSFGSKWGTEIRGPVQGAKGLISSGRLEGVLL